MLFSLRQYICKENCPLNYVIHSNVLHYEVPSHGENVLRCFFCKRYFQNTNQSVLLLLQLRMKKVSGAAALDESSLFCRFLGSFHSIGNSIPRPSSSRNFSLSTLGVPEFSGIVPSRGFIVKSEMLFLGGNLVLNNKPN